MSESFSRKHWYQKFQRAGRGVLRGMHGQSSFVVHIAAALAVVTLALVLQMKVLEWCLLVLCISVVIGAELFNSALEFLAQAITRDQHPQLADALDTASGAVLVVALGAACVGLALFLPALLRS